MKKILRVTLFSLLILVIIALAIVHIIYTTFSPGDKDVPVNASNLAYFQESYGDCRQSFLAEAGLAPGQYDHAELFSVRVPSQSDPDLFIDFLYLPPLHDSGKLLVLSSGVHGVEGFTGSAVQQMFLRELLTQEVLMETGILFMHSVNPYGFKHLRRVTENNVDLNRGSGTDPSLFETSNPGYGVLNDMLNPQGKVSTLSLRNQFFYLITISKMLKESMGVLRQVPVIRNALLSVEAGNGPGIKAEHVSEGQKGCTV